MTKLEIQNAIDSALSIVITKAKVILGLNNLTNELFNAPVIEDTDGTLTITSQPNANITYKVAFTKKGNLVTCNGTFKNTSASIISMQSFLQITDDIYKPKSISPANILFNATTTNGTVVQCVLSYTLFSMRALGSIGVGSEYSFNFSYIIND